MNVKRLTHATALAIGIAVAATTVGTATAAANPGPNPCGVQNCQGPGGDRGGPDGPGHQDELRWRGGGVDRGWRPPAPPPDQAWRGVDQGRFDHQPFNYQGNWVTPVFDPGFNNWGFWLLGIWIPL